MVLADRDAVDAASLALELRAAKNAAAPVRAAAAALTAALLIEAAKASAKTQDGQISAADQARIRELLAARLTLLAIDVSAHATAAVSAAVRLALRQEKPTLAALGMAVPNTAAVTAAVMADPTLAAAGDTATASLVAQIQRISTFAAAAPMATEAQIRDVAARASSAVSTVEAEVRTTTNRALNETTRQIVLLAEPLPEPTVTEPPARTQAPATDSTPPVADRSAATTPPERTPLQRAAQTPGLRVVWQAERDACIVCGALSGKVADPRNGVGFDEDATFGKPGSAMPVWPPGMPLMTPPRHRYCRCRLRIISADNTLVPAALAREARRSVARGFSAHNSRPARLTAADRLLARGANLPKTVKARSARDVERGTFSTRHRPRVPELRAD